MRRDLSAHAGPGGDCSRRAHAPGRRRALARTLSSMAGLLVLAAGSLSHAQQGAQSNRYAATEDIARGASSFRYHCAGCHGPEGRGGRSPDLSGRSYRNGTSDSALFQTIRYGIPGSEMRGTRFPDKRVWQLVSYVQTLRQGAAREAVPGDSAKGEVLFRRHGCLECHWVNGAGGRLGPELSGIGDGRSLKSLRTALLAPDTELDPAYWQLRVVAQDGKLIRGMVLHEDSFSIRLLDLDERLRSLEKRDLREINIVKNSFMPSYEGQLKGDDLENLVSYLYSLRK